MERQNQRHRLQMGAELLATHALLKWGRSFMFRARPHRGQTANLWVLVMRRRRPRQTLKNIQSALEAVEAA
jgi:hypothetical protein